MTVSEKNAVESMLRPSSIAVVGASSREGSLGAQVMQKITGFGYKGQIYPINPKSPEIFGIKAYCSVTETPGPMDTAVICIPGRFVIDVMHDLHKKGVSSCIIISAGFKETGPEGIEREKALLALAQKYNIRVVGPNCFGIINGSPEISLDCTFARNPAPRGHLGFISQSGAVGAAVNEDLKLTGMGLSLFVTLGNRMDFDENEALEFMANDENTRVIAMYLENFADPVKFLKTASLAVKKKPVLLLKAGKSEMGAAAAASHTGQLAQSDRMVSALLEKAGVIRVGSVAEMIMAAKALYNGVIPEKQDLAVITNAGGFGVMAMDKAEELELKLARFSPETTEFLQANLPPEASCKNPVDLLGTANETHYRTALEGALKDPAVGAVIYNFGPPVMQKADPIAQQAADLTFEYPNKPILSIFMNRHRIMEPLQKAQEKGIYIPKFDCPEDAVWGYSRLLEYAAVKNRKNEEIPSLDINRELTDEIINRAKKEGRTKLDFDEGQRVLEAYGIKTARSQKIMPGDNLTSLLEGMKFPMALKPASGDIVHKTEMNAVRLGINNPGELKDAMKEVAESIASHTGKPYIHGFMAQEMVTGAQEVIIGFAEAEQGIKLVMFGLGGIFVELLKDVSFGIAPLSPGEAQKMVEKTKGSRLLRGFRGKPGYACEDVIDILMRVSLLAANHPIHEMDINPLMVGGNPGSSRAVDVRIIL